MAGERSEVIRSSIKISIQNRIMVRRNDETKIENRKIENVDRKE
jgi:hypothetical protein